MSKWVINLFAAVVVAAWAACIAATFMKTGYTVPATVQWLASILGGVAFGKLGVDASGVGRRNRDDDEH